MVPGCKRRAGSGAVSPPPDPRLSHRGLEESGSWSPVKALPRPYVPSVKCVKDSPFPAKPGARRGDQAQRRRRPGCGGGMGVDKFARRGRVWKAIGLLLPIRLEGRVQSPHLISCGRKGAHARGGEPSARDPPTSRPGSRDAVGRGGEATEAGPGALKGRRRNGGGRVWVPTSTTPRPRGLGPRLPPEPARCAIPGRRRRGPLRVFLRLLELRPRRPSPAAVDKSSPPRPGRRPISQSGRRGGASWGCARVLQPRPGRRPQPRPRAGGARASRFSPRPPAQMFSRGAFQAAFQGPSSGFAGRECAAQGAIATWQGLGSHWPG